MGNLCTLKTLIYRTVSAMEAAGAKVHRQLIVRTLGIPAQSIGGLLENLVGIVTEYTISQRQGLYGWRGRHSLIAEILTKYKYADQDETYSLFDKIISQLNPSYDVEIRTIRDMCDMESGIGRIRSRSKQNYLLRKMISLAPSERVPRHRLIHNLIETADFDQAENEIRIFEKELRRDPPIYRYKIKLLLGRSRTVQGILNEDRAAMLEGAVSVALDGLRKFPDDKNMYRSYCEVGVNFIRLTGRWDVYDDAITRAKEAAERIMDPDLRRIIGNYEGLADRIQRGIG